MARLGLALRCKDGDRFLHWGGRAGVYSGCYCRMQWAPTALTLVSLYFATVTVHVCICACVYVYPCYTRLEAGVGVFLNRFLPYLIWNYVHTCVGM